MPESYHTRLVVTRELSHTIHYEICLEDAVVKVLPIIKKLGKDSDDSVREALAGDLDKIICFYYEVKEKKENQTKDYTNLNVCNIFIECATFTNHSRRGCVTSYSCQRIC